MNWFYADNGRQRGPVSESEFDALVASGSIQPATLVWREGMEKWQPLSEVRAVGLDAGGPPPTPAAAPEGSAPISTSLAAGNLVCSVCGKTFTEDQVIRFGPTIVCGGCKPIFLQRLREGASTSTGAGSGDLSSAEILACDYDTDIGGYLGRSWEAFKADAGITIGASVLVYLCMIAGGLIPFLGPIFQLVCTGPLMGGIWFFYIRRARGERATLGDAFSGFGPKFVPLFLAQLIPALILIGIMIVLAVVVFAVGVPAGVIGANSNNPVVPGVGLVVLIAVGVVVMLGLMVIQVCWMFALPLVIDKGLNFWPALELSRKVVMKHFWWTLLLMIVVGLLSSIGAVACLVGMLVTGPWAFGALAQHYNRVFGRLRQGG